MSKYLMTILTLGLLSLSTSNAANLEVEGIDLNTPSHTSPSLMPQIISENLIPNAIGN